VRVLTGKPGRQECVLDRHERLLVFAGLKEHIDHEPAHQAHGRSEAVRQFEAVYRPELAGGPVVFTDYVLIAANRRP
jgi:hypothetical protein